MERDAGFSNIEPGLRSWMRAEQGRHGQQAVDREGLLLMIMRLRWYQKSTALESLRPYGEHAHDSLIGDALRDILTDACNAVRPVPEEQLSAQHPHLLVLPLPDTPGFMSIHRNETDRQADSPVWRVQKVVHSGNAAMWNCAGILLHTGDFERRTASALRMDAFYAVRYGPDVVDVNEGTALEPLLSLPDEADCMFSKPGLEMITPHSQEGELARAVLAGLDRAVAAAGRQTLQ